jgi:hypothetical protein
MGTDASAEIIQPEATALWNLSMTAILIYLIAFPGFFFLCIGMIFIRNETVKLNEQLKKMQTSPMKEIKYKTGSF